METSKTTNISLISQIKKDQLQARKQRDTTKTQLLTTLIGEAEIIGKNAGNRESTDVEVVGVVKKFMTANSDNISLLNDNSSALTIQATNDNNILLSYLPQQLTVDDITSFVLNETKDVAGINIKMMGGLMKKLQSEHPGRVDGKMASQCIRKVLLSLTTPTFKE